MACGASAQLESAKRAHYCNARSGIQLVVENFFVATAIVNRVQSSAGAPRWFAPKRAGSSCRGIPGTQIARQATLMSAPVPHGGTRVDTCPLQAAQPLAVPLPSGAPRAKKTGCAHAIQE